ncbi:homoserine dehydrogenase [Anaerosalibacter massiliensis]|uniref:Homoserine dehydrogenase n=1 Tax=Anaerosalibacter massiliensis TaxID=1347392 RepID=A0A9X2MIS7_9FIRM|nr:homoserine dehydrogenase [Anaerosalibacter massiliensis]MCR2044419.1 homoserine dehydrogenase [Anaerosalibacter massiliensis]
MINIGLMGLGTVGSGVYEIINNRRRFFEDEIGEKIKIKKVLVKNKNKNRNIDIDDKLLTLNPKDILDDPEVDIVIDVLSEKEIAYDYLKYALENKKHVVTANKAVVSSKMEELLYLSKENNKAFLFEASVGGGIPIINSLKQGIKADDIFQIQGILNGTTNYILTKMYEKGICFKDALKDAQDKGYAEADPTDDIKGYDTGRKLAILSTIAYNQPVDSKFINCRGIDEISIEDINEFRKLKLVPKLIGSSQRSDNHIYASVEPLLVKDESFFSNVKDAFNIISLRGYNTGELRFYGQGAGKNPTANSVVLDVLDIVKGTYTNGKVYENRKISGDKYLTFDGEYYLRLSSKDGKDNNYLLNILNMYNSKHKVINDKESLIVILPWTSENLINKMINEIKLNVEDIRYFYSGIYG